jgi:hypothetical protein
LEYVCCRKRNDGVFEHFTHSDPREYLLQIVRLLSDAFDETPLLQQQEKALSVTFPAEQSLHTALTEASVAFSVPCASNPISAMFAVCSTIVVLVCSTLHIVCQLTFVDVAVPGRDPQDVEGPPGLCECWMSGPTFYAVYVNRDCCGLLLKIRNDRYHAFVILCA